MNIVIKSIFEVQSEFFVCLFVLNLLSMIKFYLKLKFKYLV